MFQSTKIDKKAVARSFSKAASHYDDFAQLQRDIGNRLLSNIDASQSFDQIIDLGCGTGYFSEKLLTSFPKSELTCFDLSQAMLNEAKRKELSHCTYVCGDIDDLPQFDCLINLIYSNLALQWSQNPADFLTEIYRQTSVNGKVYFSTLLDGTLNELATAWKQVDDFTHVNEFISKSELQVIIERSPFKETKIVYETRELEYKNVFDLMHALKGIGANHVNGHHNVLVSGRTLIKQLELGYLPLKNEHGYLPLTYQVCYVELTKTNKG